MGFSTKAQLLLFSTFHFFCFVIMHPFFVFFFTKTDEADPTPCKNAFKPKFKSINLKQRPMFLNSWKHFKVFFLLPASGRTRSIMMSPYFIIVLQQSLPIAVHNASWMGELVIHLPPGPLV